MLNASSSHFDPTATLVAAHPHRIERAAAVAREATDVAACDAGMPPQSWSLESVVAVAVMFGAHMIEQAKLLLRRDAIFKERCHADLHLPRAFHFGRRQGHAG
jgi:hypothetical protein